MSPSTDQRVLAPVVLVCTDCGHIFQPDLVSPSGCERCGGWTWIAQTNPANPPEPPRLPRPREQLVDNGDRSDTSTTSPGGTR